MAIQVGRSTFLEVIHISIPRAQRPQMFLGPRTYSEMDWPAATNSGTVTGGGVVCFYGSAMAKGAGVWDPALLKNFRIPYIHTNGLT